MVSSFFVNSLTRIGLCRFARSLLADPSSLVVFSWTEDRNSLYLFFVMIKLDGLALLYLRCPVMSSSCGYKCAVRSM